MTEATGGRWLGRVGWSLFALVVVGLPLAVMILRPAPMPPALGPLPAFALVDQEGAPVEARDLAGSVTVLDFIFTRCTTICPLLTRKMAELTGELTDSPIARHPIRFLSVSVDPDYDRPEVLKEYAWRNAADPQRWRFLTGERAVVQALADGLQQALERGPDGPAPNIVHSERFVLIDPEGGVRGTYPSDTEGVARLIGDARALAGHPW